MWCALGRECPHRIRYPGAGKGFRAKLSLLSIVERVRGECSSCQFGFARNVWLKCGGSSVVFLGVDASGMWRLTWVSMFSTSPHVWHTSRPLLSSANPDDWHASQTREASSESSIGKPVPHNHANIRYMSISKVRTIVPTIFRHVLVLTSSIILLRRYFCL